MPILSFDARHLVTMSNASGAHEPFPFAEGARIQVRCAFDKFAIRQEILEDVSPQARWFALLYPEGRNELYDTATGLMRVEVRSVTNPNMRATLHWLVDHEDSLLAVCISANKAGTLEPLGFGQDVYVLVQLVVNRIETIASPQDTEQSEHYAMLLPHGARSGRLIESEIELD